MEPLRFYVHVDPWDLLDEGVDTIVDRLVGELGIDGISVSAVTAPVCVFRTHDVKPRTFRCEAGAHFHPDAKRFAGTRLRPPPCAYLKTRHPIETVAKACLQRNLKLRLRVNVCHSPTLVERFPFAACKDAFGDASAAWICPANPDVQAYLRALGEDLAERFAPHAVDLEDAALPPPPLFHPGRTNVDPNANWHLSVMCFCESCRQTAAAEGIRAEPLAEGIRAAAPAFELVETDWSSYARSQAASVQRLLAAAQTGTTPTDVIEVNDAVRFIKPIDARTTAQETPIHDLGMHVTIPGEGAEVVRRIRAQAQAGIRAFVFDTYGTLSDERFDAVRQAIRFAKRDHA